MVENQIPLASLARKLSEAKWKGKPPEYVSKVQIDSRKCSPGELFVALQGENTHGHEFVGSARENGAVAALVEKPQDAGIPELIVPSTLKALQKLASLYRDRLSDQVVGITGSCGKTTLKEMLADLLAVEFDVARTPGNYNNHIGLPLTVLNHGGSEVLVAEVAMNQKGEIKHLSSILSPATGVITHIGPAHLAGVNSVDELAREKADLLGALPREGQAVVPGWVQKRGVLTEASRAPVVEPGREPGADVQVDWVVGDDSSEVEIGFRKFEISLGREELVKDAVLAAVVALQLGLSEAGLRKGMDRLKALEGRGRELKVDGSVVIDGSYNANPDSMKAALRRLKELPGPRLAVLGTMKELGEKSRAAHRELGELLSEIDNLEAHFVGGGKSDVSRGMEGPGALHLHDTVEEIIDLDPKKFKSVLVKASNAVGLWKLIERWVDNS